MKSKKTITEKIICILLAALFIFNHQYFTVSAADRTFTDTYGNSFTYDAGWSYKQNDLGDGYSTYEFWHNNGDVLQLSYQKLSSDITEQDVKALCNESGSELIYKTSYSYNGNTWYQTEYAGTAYFYFGSVNKVLYRIGVAKTNSGEGTKLAKNIMSGVSEKKSTSNSSSSSNNYYSNNKKDAATAGLVEELKTFVIYGGIFGLLWFVWKKIKSNKPQENNIKQNNSNNPLLAFNDRIFPNNCRDYIKKQMRILTKGTTSDEDNIKTYIYCMTHYLVNGEDIEYVTKMLPVAHPELKDKEIIDNVVKYTKMCSIGDPSKIDVSDQKTTETISVIAEEFKKQSINRKNNADKNKEPYDENRGLEKDKPMYFAGARAAEQYLNSLTDEEGNKLHTGIRYSYSVDGIPDMLDCYQLLREDGKSYGELHLSIYGQDNYEYVPKGYKHPTLSKNITNKNEVDKTKKTNEKKDNASIVKDNLTEKRTTKKKKKSIVDNSEAVSFCRKCGAKLSADAEFCHKCGTKIIRS